MDAIDHIFSSLTDSRTDELPTIACLYTGDNIPSSCAPMPRRPEPAAGMLLDDNFRIILAQTIAQNPAVHDGAVMIGRQREGDVYRIIGWSYRLFPPPVDALVQPNRGSAFNSCIAMSLVSQVDRVYLFSKAEMLRFEQGQTSRL